LVNLHFNCSNGILSPYNCSASLDLEFVGFISKYHNNYLVKQWPKRDAIQKKNHYIKIHTSGNCGSNMFGEEFAPHIPQLRENKLIVNYEKKTPCAYFACIIAACG